MDNNDSQFAGDVREALKAFNLALQNAAKEGLVVRINTSGASGISVHDKIFNYTVAKIDEIFRPL